MALQRANVAVQLFDHGGTVAKGFIQFRLGFQVSRNGCAVFTLNFFHHGGHTQQPAVGISEGKPQLFSAFSRAAQEALIAAGCL